MSETKATFLLSEPLAVEEVVAEVMRQLRNTKPERYTYLLRGFIPRVVRRLRTEDEVKRLVSSWLSLVLQNSNSLSLEAWRIRVFSMPTYPGVRVALGYYRENSENDWLEFNLSKLKKGGFYAQYDSRRKIQDLPRLWEDVLKEIDRSEDGWINVENDPPRRKRRKRHLPRSYREADWEGLD